MKHVFPSAEWLHGFAEKLNQDEHYQRIAHNWEGDVLLILEADDRLAQQINYYFDLWHGACRQAKAIDLPEEISPAFVLHAPYQNWSRILQGDLHPLQAMLTQKLVVKGNMAYLMRHVPTVLDFTRCAREVTSSTL